MLAAAAGFRRTGGAARSIGQLERRVAREGRKARAIGDDKLESRDTTVGRGRTCSTLCDARTIRPRREIFFELTAEYGVNADRAQPLLVERGVESVRADASRR